MNEATVDLALVVTTGRQTEAIKCVCLANAMIVDLVEKIAKNIPTIIFDHALYSKLDIKFEYSHNSFSRRSRT